MRRRRSPAWNFRLHRYRYTVGKEQPASESLRRLIHRVSIHVPFLARTAQLAELLAARKGQCKFNRNDNWVFASQVRGGRKSYGGPAILRHGIRPTSEQIGITKRIGWQTFRHPYCTPLRSPGVEFKVMQELIVGTAQGHGSGVQKDPKLWLFAPAKFKRN